MLKSAPSLVRDGPGEDIGASTDLMRELASWEGGCVLGLLFSPCVLDLLVTLLAMGGRPSPKEAICCDIEEFLELSTELGSYSWGKWMCDALDAELGGVTALRELDAGFEGPASAINPSELPVWVSNSRAYAIRGQ